MFFPSKLGGVAAAALLVSSAVAHPGEVHEHHEMVRQIKARDVHAAAGKRSLGQCSGSLVARELRERSIARRAAIVEDLRKKRDITTTPKKWRRDLAALEAWEAVNHNMTGINSYGIFTDHETIFDANTSCILAPEVTAGPYYVLGEWMRHNVKESKYSDGVDLYLEVQYVDITTCEPIPNMAVDIWNANATGIYSGIVTTDNVAADGLNSTFLRGIQLTDYDGVASFETIFPGHYQGRATHTHLLSHMNATVQANGTISVWNTQVAHIGQLFWGEELRTAVEATELYVGNTQSVTSNDDDMWSIVQADASYDPFPQYIYLGEDVTDGLFAWIQIGVNATVDYSSDEYYAVAGYVDADGGHASSSSFGGGGGGGGGNGSFPSGAFPSGAIPTGSGAPPASTSTSA